MRSDIKKFQDNLSFERYSRGISQNKLAQTIGISQAHLSFIEHGKRELTPERYYQIMEYFDHHDKKYIYS